MKLSKILVRTLREYPVDLEMQSQKILLKAGLITKVGTGLYAFTPLGEHFLENIKKIIENNVENADACKISIPHINSFSYLSEKNNNYLFHSYDENIILINFLKDSINSYKQLPLFFYELDKEFNYKNKSNLGIMGSKENLKAYFYAISDEENSILRKEKLIKLYENIFQIMDLKYEIVEDKLDSTIKFIIYNDLGDTTIASCTNCSYGNDESKASFIADEKLEECLKKINKVHTPNIKTIEELGEFFKVPYRKFTKTIIYEADDSTIAVMVRGDRDIDEVKVREKLKIIGNLNLASEETVKKVTSAEIGFAGPINIKVDKTLVDEEVTKMNNFMVGANETGYHYENVNYGRDFQGIIDDFRKIHEQSKCVLCKNSLVVKNAFVIGEIKKVDESLIKNQSATFLDEKGKNKFLTIYKGFIDIYKIISWVIEQNNDELGGIWPREASPFQAIITIANVKDEQQLKLGEKFYSDLMDLGLNIILDDRKERAGVKFKDADLWGIPIRITIGKNIKEGKVEIKLRNSNEGEEVPINVLKQNIKNLLGIV